MKGSSGKSELTLERTTDLFKADVSAFSGVKKNIPAERIPQEAKKVANMTTNILVTTMSDNRSTINTADPSSARNHVKTHTTFDSPLKQTCDQVCADQNIKTRKVIH